MKSDNRTDYGKHSNPGWFVANSKKCSAIFYIFYEIFSISVTAS